MLVNVTCKINHLSMSHLQVRIFLKSGLVDLWHHVKSISTQSTREPNAELSNLKTKWKYPMKLFHNLKRIQQPILEKKPTRNIIATLISRYLHYAQLIGLNIHTALPNLLYSPKFSWYDAIRWKTSWRYFNSLLIVRLTIWIVHNVVFFARRAVQHIINISLEKWRQHV